jgi:dynein heavy chain
VTTLSFKEFPIGVLEKGIKVIVEEASGIKNHLLDMYHQMGPLEGASDQYKKLLFGLTMFHVVIHERRKFGKMGWNNPYEFSYQDFSLTRGHMIQYNQTELEFVCSLLYGGCIADKNDAELLRSIFTQFVSANTLVEDHTFSTSYLYKTLKSNVIEYVRELSPRTPPELFGMHINADITYGHT